MANTCANMKERAYEYCLVVNSTESGIISGYYGALGHKYRPSRELPLLHVVPSLFYPLPFRIVPSKEHVGAERLVLAGIASCIARYTKPRASTLALRQIHEEHLEERR